MSDAASEGLSAEAHAGPIDVDVYCSGCRYNLRGIALGAVCPECAHPVAQSFDPELVLRLPRQTREFLVRRLKQFEWWAVGSAVQINLLLYLMLSYPPGDPLPLIVRLAVDAAQYVAPLFWLAAWSRLWFCTQDFGFQHSLVTGQERPRVERVIVILLFLLWSGSHIVIATTSGPHHDAGSIRVVVLFLMFLLFMNWLHCVVALRMLAQLCQSPYLQSRGTVLLVMLPFALICGLPFFIGPSVWLLLLALYAWGVRRVLLGQPATAIPNPLVV